MKMLNKRIVSLCTGIAMLAMIGTSTMASTDTARTDVTDEATVYAHLEEIKNSPEVMALAAEFASDKDGTIQNAKAIPALSAVYVGAIDSEKAGWEDLDFIYNPTTKYDHGGSMVIYTMEIGYGDSHYRKAEYRDALNGGSCNLLQNLSVDLDGDRVIDGWIQAWEAYGDMGPNTGTFKYTTRSAGLPYNTMSNSLYVR